MCASQNIKYDCWSCLNPIYCFHNLCWMNCFLQNFIFYMLHKLRNAHLAIIKRDIFSYHTSFACTLFLMPVTRCKSWRCSKNIFHPLFLSHKGNSLSNFSFTQFRLTEYYNVRSPACRSQNVRSAKFI